VVAVARGGVPEVVAGEVNGLLIAQPEAPAMAEALARLIASPPEAQRLGRSARDTIAARFSADQMVNATLGLYQRLRGSARLARPHRR